MAQRVSILLLLSSFFPSHLLASQPEKPLKIGLIYSGDSYAVAHAHDNGLFAKHKVPVVLVPFTSAFERDNALLAGQIDGANGDLISTSLLRAKEEKIRITT